MALTALRGALGFLTRLPIGRQPDALAAFQHTPVAFPLAGYLIGALLALPFLLIPGPATTTAVVFLAWVYLVTGITHADGLADLGDALATHADPSARRDAMTDTHLGAGGTLTLAIALLALTLAAHTIATQPLDLIPLVIAAEVGAKLAMATLVCLGTAAHDGLGAGFTAHHPPRALVLPVLATVPAGYLMYPHPAAATAVLAALATALLVGWWATRHLDGITGDILGAANELARVTALHAGLLAWIVL